MNGGGISGDRKDAPRKKRSYSIHIITAQTPTFQRMYIDQCATTAPAACSNGKENLK